MDQPGGTGAWIDATNGAYAWLDARGHLVHSASATEALGLPPEVIAALGKVSWDLSSCPLQETLAAAMDRGLIRVRLTENTANFECRIPLENAVLGAFQFMVNELDPRKVCRFNSMVSGKSKEFRWESGMKPLRNGDLTFLTPYWLRPQTRPAVPAPWFLFDLRDEDRSLGVCGLDAGLALPTLVDMVRPHVGPAGGWLGLPDGRRWRLDADEPPLVRIDQAGIFMGFEVCPDCGWPRQGEVAPCKCWMRSMCKVCSMPSHWPIPMHDTIVLDGQMLHVPHVAGFAHRCISWPTVRVIALDQISER